MKKLDWPRWVYVFALVSLCVEMGQARSIYQGVPDYLVEYLNAKLTQNTKQEYENTYANGTAFQKKCVVCHGDGTGGAITSSNPFGAQFKTATIVQVGSNLEMNQTDFGFAMDSVMSVDSDGDGATNEAEFIALTDPNDASSKPGTTAPTPTPTPTPNTGGGGGSSNNSSSKGPELKDAGCGFAVHSKTAKLGLSILLLLPLFFLLSLKRRV